MDNHRLILKRLLGYLVVEEKEGHGPFYANPPLSGDDLFNSFAKSKIFEDFYNDCYQRIESGSIVEPDPTKNIFLEFLGRIYREMVYFYLSAKQPDSRILLSAEKSLKFYEALYPGSELIMENFGLDSLMGISVPGGLVVETNNGLEKIVEVNEYSFLNPRQDFIEHMKKKVKSLNVSRHKYPEFFSDALQFLYIPQAEYTFNQKSISIALHKKIGLEKMPFDRRKFAEFSRTIWSHYIHKGNNHKLEEIYQIKVLGA